MSRFGGGGCGGEDEMMAAVETRIPNGADEEAWRKEMFGTLRILVAGRSGAGKSALLRLLVGADGPQTVSSGMAGVQDINKEFCYKEEYPTPLLFHDSNGVDLDQANFRIIIEFLRDRQGREDFSEHVHVLWYVASACEDRMKEDRGLLKELITGFHIPVLVVLTHTDEVSPHKKEKAMCTLQEMIDEAVAACKGRTPMKPCIVTVGNDMELRPEDHSIIVNHWDVEGLQSVSSSTYNLLDNKQMRATWAAAQVHDMHMKIEQSAHKIASYAKMSILTTPAAIVPYTDVLKIPALFYEIFKALCRIWEIPGPLQQVLSKSIFRKECIDAVLRSICSDTAHVVGLSAVLVANVLSNGSILEAIVPTFVSGHAVLTVKNSTIAFKGFALYLLAAILMAKSRQKSKHRWDPTVTPSSWEAVCNSILEDANLRNDLYHFANSSHSSRDTLRPSRRKIVEGVLQSKIIQVFDTIWRGRPTSFQTVS